MFLQNAVADALNNTEWAFPLAECFHIGGFAVAVGTIALVDFRMLNLGLRKATPASLLRYTEAWTMIALVFILFSGAALYISQTFVYIPNPVFQAKMVLLIIAIIYNFTVHRKIAASPTASPGVQKVVALVSLLLWVAIVYGGIFIAFV
jgi:hypothetical protein